MSSFIVVAFASFPLWATHLSSSSRFSLVGVTLMSSGDEADAYARQALIPIRQRLGTFKVLVRTIVVLAPLAGLLGTVAGMIETFDSLGDRALFASSGGVAGGIAQALLTTQMGLIVAVPGLIAGRLLDRRQVRIEDDLEQLRELLVLKTQETLA